MKYHITVLLCIFSVTFLFTHPSVTHANPAPEYDLILDVDDIDSLDTVIFDLNKMVISGQFIEIPVYILSDDQINTLDFSMGINVENLEFVSIIDHTGEMQFAAYLNPNDLKLRFTSNSFSPYPVGDFKVVSIRFEVLSPVVHPLDFNMLTAYLNGDPCSTILRGSDVMVANQEIISNEIFVNPNPAHDVFYVNIDEPGLLNIYDLKGRTVVNSQNIHPHSSNLVDVHMLPKGNYTVRIVTRDNKVKVQKIVLQ